LPAEEKDSHGNLIPANLNRPLQAKRAGRVLVARRAINGPVWMSASCYYSSRMVCPTAKILFENYARAAIELFESADNLANLTGQHERFAEAMRYSKQTHEKCFTARLAFEQHRAQHGCREGVTNEL
jgi:hypothetical protein